MPTSRDGEIDEADWPSLFRVLRRAARGILKCEQTRLGKKPKGQSDRLTAQLIRWLLKQWSNLFSSIARFANLFQDLIDFSSRCRRHVKESLGDF